MPMLNEGVIGRVALGSSSWWWPAGLVGLYLVPAIFAGAGTALPLSVVLLSLILAASLIVLSEIDRRTFRLPDLITLPLLLCGVLTAAIMGDGMLWRVFSAATGLAVILLVDQGYRAWRGVSGIGLGDAKLFAASGAWLGAQALPTVLLWACISALLVLLVARGMGQRFAAHTPIPFGCFLAFGTWLVWCLGPLH